MLEQCLANFDKAKWLHYVRRRCRLYPGYCSSKRSKKQDGGLNIELKKTTDILKTLAQQKRAGQVLVGFALETNNEEQYAIEKLKRKILI
jgi:phosphopantothenoylcysteine decarboxylase/phosphopantothenate--cysteine ligase